MNKPSYEELEQERYSHIEKIAELVHELTIAGSQLTLTKAEVGSLRSAISRVTQERNELAAQVERLRSDFPLFDDDGLCEREHHCEFTLLHERKRLHKILSETPSAAVAALKAHERDKDLRAQETGDGCTS